MHILDIYYDNVFTSRDIVIENCSWSNSRLNMNIEGNVHKFHSDVITNFIGVENICMG